MAAIAAALFLALLPPPDVKEIKGRVLDAAGKPAAGVPIAPFWNIKDGAWTPGGPLLATSDKNGAFATKILWPGRPTAYFALDKDGQRGGIIVIDDATVDQSQVIKLAPLAAIRGKFDFSQCRAPVSLLVSLMARPAETFVGQWPSAGEDLQFRLPPGEYALRMFSREAETFNHSFTVPAGQTEVDLGALVIVPSVIAQHYGKEPPALGVTEARGLDKDFKISDLKGKWVLIDFWGHW